MLEEKVCKAMCKCEEFTGKQLATFLLAPAPVPLRVI